MKLQPVLLLLCLSVFCKAQSPAPHFEKLKHPKSDTAFINACNALSEYYVYDNNDSAAYFNQMSLTKSTEKRCENFNFKGIYLKAELERLNKNYKEALKFAEKAMQIAKQNNNTGDIVEAFNVSGDIFQSAKQGKLAVAGYLSGFELSKKKNYKEGIVSSGISLGQYFKDNNDPTNALGYYLDIYPLTIELKDTMKIFSCCINLGSLYERTNDKEKALRFYKKALVINQNDNDENGMAICYFKIGKLYINFLNDSAKYYLGKTMEIHLKRKDELGLIFDYSFLASMYARSGDFKKAEENYTTSLELANKHNDSSRISAVYSYKAEMYKLQNNYAKILDCYKNCLRYMQRKTAGETRMSIYKNIALIHKKMGNYKEALDNFELFKAWSDSSININETKKQTELKLGFEFNQVQEKLRAEADAKELINKSELETERKQRNLLLGGLGLISLFLVIAVRNYRAKQKANSILEKQKTEIENQKKLVDEKNLEISDSINYALHIQTACLPEKKEMENYFPQHALFFRPKDVVSGDFYWAAQNDSTALIAVADCTGHGVPGAITSMIGSMLLNEIFYVKKLYQPNEILTELNRLVKLTLRQEETSRTKDGMDMAFCSWNKKTNQLSYSGANRQLYILRKGEEVTEYKATKQSIGGYTPLIQNFELHSITLQKGDTVVLTTDGYADQFGGEKEKKFTTKEFRTMLSEIKELDTEGQRKLLEERFDKWKTNFAQTDDVLVFMFKV